MARKYCNISIWTWAWLLHSLLY